MAPPATRVDLDLILKASCAKAREESVKLVTLTYGTEGDTRPIAAVCRALLDVVIAAVAGQRALFYPGWSSVIR